MRNIKMQSLLPVWLLCSVCLLMPAGCGVYSFTGTNIDYSKIKTFSVQNFLNESGGGPSNLAQNFTERLKDYYTGNTNLLLIPFDGDLQFSGNIVGYDMTPLAPVGNETAALNRLTIRIEVEFVNNVEEEKSFKQTFSFYGDFSQNQTLSQVEGQLIDVIFEQIILDIFNKSVADW